MHLHGEHTRGDVAARLRAAGLAVEARMVYRQVELPLSDTAHALLQGEAPVILPLFSPRSARLLAGQIEPPRAPCRIVAISTATAQAWTFDTPIILAKAKTGAAMIEGIRAASPG